MDVTIDVGKEVGAAVVQWVLSTLAAHSETSPPLAFLLLSLLLLAPLLRHVKLLQRLVSAWAGQIKGLGVQSTNQHGNLMWPPPCSTEQKQ